jgi:hypothetical protein
MGFLIFICIVGFFVIGGMIFGLAEGMDRMEQQRAKDGEI